MRFRYRCHCTSRGIRFRRRIRHAVVADGLDHLPLSLLLSSLVCHFRSVQLPKMYQGKCFYMCEAFSTVGIGGLNHVKIKIFRAFHGS